jgi:predicted secreted protein
MSNPVHGSFGTLELWITDAWFAVLCGVDFTLQVNQETIYKTGPTSGTWRERVSRLSEWSASVTGLTMVENSATVVTFFYALQDAVRLKKQLIRLTYKDIDGNGKQITGDAYVVSNEINGPVTEFSTATILLEGTGLLNIGAITPPTPITITTYSDYWVTVNGQDYISGASAIYGFTLGATDTILEVDIEGVEYDLTTGAILNRMCKFTSGTGRITFEAGAVLFTGTERVFVEFKRTV